MQQRLTGKFKQPILYRLVFCLSVALSLCSLSPAVRIFHVTWMPAYQQGYEDQVGSGTPWFVVSPCAWLHLLPRPLPFNCLVLAVACCGCVLVIVPISPVLFDVDGDGNLDLITSSAKEASGDIGTGHSLPYCRAVLCIISCYTRCAFGLC